MEKWLISAAGITLTSVALIENIQKIELIVDSPRVLNQAIQHNVTFQTEEEFQIKFPEGRYLVKYKEISEEEFEELDFSQMAYAISFSARLNGRSKSFIGGFKSLSKALSDYDVCCILDKKHAAYLMANFWIVEPVNPKELAKLKQILESYAIVYGFNDGSGTMNVSNTYFGNGVHAS